MRNLIIILAVIMAAVVGYFAVGEYLLEPIEPTTDTESDTATTTDDVKEMGDEETLTNFKWSWVKTELPGDEEVTAPAGDRFILSFEDEGRMGSLTDCNSIGGSYSLDGEVLSLGQFVMTMMYCEGSLETKYAEHLGLVNSYRLEGDTLIMNLNRDFGTMIFTKYQSNN